MQGSGSALSQAPLASTPSQETPFAEDMIIIHQVTACTAQQTPEQLQRSTCMKAGTFKFEAGYDPPCEADLEAAGGGNIPDTHGAVQG